MSTTKNAGRCPRCNEFVIAEELQTHSCRIPTRGAETIFLDWLDSGSFTNQNDDLVRMAKGLDGTLYSLIVCKHNPPHSTKRKFTPEDTKKGLDRTSVKVLLPCRLTP